MAKICFGAVKVLCNMVATTFKVFTLFVGNMKVPCVPGCCCLAALESLYLMDKFVLCDSGSTDTAGKEKEPMSHSVVSWLPFMTAPISCFDSLPCVYFFRSGGDDVQFGLSPSPLMAVPCETIACVVNSVSLRNYSLRGPRFDAIPSCLRPFKG